jgi:ribosomal subunit interface protein
MQIPLQITVRDMIPSAALDARIREKVARLERFQSRITSCRVTVAGPGQHRRRGSPIEVRLDVRVPGRPGIVVNRQHEADVFVALRDAFDAASRQLEETFHESRPDAGAPAPGQAP